MNNHRKQTWVDCYWFSVLATLSIVGTALVLGYVAGVAATANGMGWQ